MGYVCRLQFLKQNEDIPIVHVNITTLKYMPKEWRTVYMSNIRVLHFHQYICGQFYKIILQRFYIFTSYLKNFHMEPLNRVFVGQSNSSSILYNLMSYFDIILLSDVILSIEPKISDADTIFMNPMPCLCFQRVCIVRKERNKKTTCIMYHLKQFYKPICTRSQHELISIAQYLADMPGQMTEVNKLRNDLVTHTFAASWLPFSEPNYAIKPYQYFCWEYLVKVKYTFFSDSFFSKMKFLIWATQISHYIVQRIII